MEDAAITVHLSDMAMVEDGRSQKLKVIGQTPAVEDVVAEDMEHKMALALEEEHIDS